MPATRSLLALLMVFALLGSDARAFEGSTAVTAPPLDWSGAPTCPRGSTDAQSGGRAAPVRLLSDVRTGLHPCFERVVFEFRDSAASSNDDIIGYDVRYASGPVTQDGSGREVEVDGEEVVLVRMKARGFDPSRPGAPRTYNGPDRMQPPDAVRIREVRRVSQFEGVQTWAVGLDARRPFTVSVLGSPARLVIDVM